MAPRVRLVPIAELLKRTDGWESTGGDPQFSIRTTPRLRWGGWALATFEVGDDSGSLSPVLFVDDGRGYSERTAIPLPSVASGAACQLIRLPNRVKRLRLDPLSRPGRFQISNFRLIPISAFGALRYLVRIEGYPLAEALRVVRRLSSEGRRRGSAKKRSKKEEMADLEVLRRSSFFDPEYYLANNDDVARIGVDPLQHYYRFGAREGRNPSAAFDTLFYLGSNPDVVQAGINPLVHFMRFGIIEGRRPTPNTGPMMPKPEAPPAEVWAELALERAPLRSDPVVDVVIPAYRGHDETLACIHSVLTAEVRTPFELVVIDDQSPEPMLSEALRELARLRLITLYTNKQNQGFVGTANRGMTLHAGRDVTLLNSDTVVYGNWLDRLREHVLRSADVGTVTPFSNNATICSYPFTNRNNGFRLEIGYQDLDALAAETNEGRAVDIPTGVGFCLYIRRACIEQIGIFDQERFDRGYGEENDFCLRAAEKGWRNILACDVFVQHTGEVSFGSEVVQRRRQTMKVLLERYPDYERTISRHVAKDPAARDRRRLDAARLLRVTGRPAMLFVTHTRGGGTERHLRDMAQALGREGVDTLVMRSLPGDEPRVMLNRMDEISLPNLNPLNLRESIDEIEDLLAAAGVFHVHVHSFAGFSPTALQLLPDLTKRLGIAYDYTFHDYLPVCPRINLIDGSGIYCGEEGEHACRVCIATNGTSFGDVDIRDWRHAYAEFLEGARRIFVPSEDAAKRLERHYPDLSFAVRPHLEPLRPPETSISASRAEGQRLRVAVIGAIGLHKGQQVLLDCAGDALRRRLPLEFVLIGYSNKETLANMPNVLETGRYRDEEVFDLIRQQACHISFLPSVWPETYCYTLTIATMAGLYPVAFDVGAQAERIRRMDWGTLLPLSCARDPRYVNDKLLSLIPQIPSTDVIDDCINRNYTDNLIAGYYGLQSIEQLKDACRHH